jgi:hypothetical protein
MGSLLTQIPSREIIRPPATRANQPHQPLCSARIKIAPHLDRDITSIQCEYVATDKAQVDTRVVTTRQANGNSVTQIEVLEALS